MARQKAFGRFWFLSTPLFFALMVISVGRVLGVEGEKSLGEKPSDEKRLPSSPTRLNKGKRDKGKGNKRKKPFELKVSAHGFARISYQVGRAVQGTPEGKRIFRSENFGLAKGFYAYGSLQMDWRLGNFRLRGEYSPFRFSPTANRFQGEYDAKSTKFTYGNLFLSLQGNQFVSFSRYAQGLKVEHRFGRGSTLTLITFETPSQVVTDVFRGNDSPGPYFLRRSPIIEGSEQVRLDERPLRRGIDYTIDYDYGTITFATPIPPTSTIAVSYEAVSFGGLGRFLGLQANWRLGEGSRLGFTFLTQRVAMRVGEGGKRRREEFLGDGTVGPLQLATRPVIPGSERVFVQGILKVRGIHYHINYGAGLITFLQPVPAGVLITVEYEQETGATSQLGLLRLLGLTYTATLKEWGRLSLQVGQSFGRQRDGRAIEIHLVNEGKERLSYSLRWRHVGRGFTRIDNPDFFRNDTGFFLDFHYELMKGLGLNLQWQDSRTSGGRFFGVSAPQGVSESRNKDFGLQLRFSRPGWPHLQIRHQRLQSLFSGTIKSLNKKLSTTIYGSYRWGHLNLEGAWERSSDQSRPFGEGQVGEELASLPSRHAMTLRKRFSLSFTPGEKLSAAFDWSENASEGTEEFRSRAFHHIFTVTYTPWQSLQISFAHQALRGASTVSSYLVGSVLTGVAGAGLSGIGYYGAGSYYYDGYGTGFGGYGTFGVTPTRPYYGLGGWETSPSGTTQGGGGIPLSRRFQGRQLLPPSRPTPPQRIKGSKSIAKSLSLFWTPLQRFSLSLDWTTNTDKGSEFITPSHQRTLTLAGTWQVSQELNLFAEFSRDRASLLGEELNESLTLIASVGLQWGRFDGLNGSISYSWMRMQNLRLAGRVPQLEESRFQTLVASIQVPLKKRWFLLGRAAWLSNKSPQGIFGGSYRNIEMELGLEYRLTPQIGLRLNWNYLRRQGDRPEQDYSATLFRAELTANF